MQVKITKVVGKLFVMDYYLRQFGANVFMKFNANPFYINIAAISLITVANLSIKIDTLMQGIPMPVA